jgi:RimJ/RimL family protein N-acetyltransferase
MTPKLITERLILREIKGNDIFGYYEILSDRDTMKLFGGPTLTNDLDNKDFVQRMKVEREKGICYFWTITLKEEKEFIGFVRLMSYNSGYYDASFSAAGEHRFDPEFLKYFDRENGWEIDYALQRNHRNKGIMKEAVSAVLEFCANENISPVYAKVNSMTNSATVGVLSYHDFKNHMPQIDERLLSKFDHQTILDNKEYGMIFIWTA